jgi:tetratricopeptide (TPR) repeat protein
MVPMKTVPHTSWLLFLPVVLFLPLSAYAETKVITSEGTYTMGDGETPLVAELRALQQAKRQAVEQAGTYIQSYTKAKHYELTADEIETVSAGIIEVEVLEKKRQLVGDGLQCSVKIKATVTVEKTDELVSLLRQKSPGTSPDLVSGYAKLRTDYNSFIAEIDRLKQQMAEARSSQEKEQTANRISIENRKYLARSYYEKATDFYANRSTSDNISLLDEAVRLDPNFSNAWMERGWFHRFGHDYETAIADASEAIRIDPNNERAYVLRGSSYYDQGKYAEAVNDYTLAINWPAGNQPATVSFRSAQARQYMNRGLAYEKLQQNYKALADFRMAIGYIDTINRTDPEWGLLKPIKALIHFRMASIYGVLGVPDEAMHNYQEACALDKQLDEKVCQLPQSR